MYMKHGQSNPVIHADHLLTVIQTGDTKMSWFSRSFYSVDMFDDVGCMFSNELKYIVGVPPPKKKTSPREKKMRKFMVRHLCWHGIFLLDFWWYNPPGNKTFSIHGILQLLSLKFEAISALMMENLVLATCGAVVVVSHCWNHGLVSWSPKRFGVRRSYGIREDLLRFECFKNKEFP